MTFAQALDALATLPVAGISNHFTPHQLPQRLYRAQLPALLVMPLPPESEQFFDQPGRAFHTISFDHGSRSAIVRVTHLYLCSIEDTASGLRAQQPALVRAIDGYLQALAGDVTLADTLLEPAQVDVEPGIYPYGQASFVGVAFRHRWHIDFAGGEVPT